jgi:VWFA-related protein
VLRTPDKPAGDSPPSGRQTAKDDPTRPAVDDGIPPVNEGYSFRVDVDSVYLNVSVRDRYSNRSIYGLERGDFEVHEDGVRQEVEQLVSGEAPFDLLLLLDISGSTRSHIDLIMEASIDFTREIKANDRIAVATFNTRCRLIQDFTGDRRDVANAIRRIRASGGTAFYDALDTSIDDYMGQIEGRKAIVVFTDGVDNQLEGSSGTGSDITFEELFYRIQEVDPIIYTIFLETEEYTKVTRRRRDSGNPIEVLGSILGGKFPRGFPNGRGTLQEAKAQLQAIADQTGGRMYSPRRIEDLFHVYSEIADDLRIQYQLGYNSTNPTRDGSWREIRVRVPDQPNAVVRTRKGYYARKSDTSPRRP